jgi:hypothetical protein
LRERAGAVDRGREAILRTGAAPAALDDVLRRSRRGRRGLHPINLPVHVGSFQGLGASITPRATGVEIELVVRGVDYDW